MAELTLNAKEAADLIGCCSVKIYDLAAQGKIPHIHIGRKLVFPKAALEKWLLDTAMAAVKPEVTPEPTLPEEFRTKSNRKKQQVKHWYDIPGCGGRKHKEVTEQPA
jgi:excisionase family DNA binding protein